MEETKLPRRVWSPREKFETVQEGVATGNISEVCRRRGITVNMYYRWRDRLYQSVGQVFAHASPDSARKRESLALEELLRKKDAVIAELTQENLELKRGRWR